MEKLYLICVLYNPTEACIALWRKFAESWTQLIFVDNTPSGQADCCQSSLPNYVGLGENKGIAAAQNVGIAKAKELGATHVIFFDQDSIVGKDLIEQLYDEFKNLQSAGIAVGAIGPIISDKENGTFYKGGNIQSTSPVKVSSIISSGTLTSMAVLDKVGGMQESLFIDLVDQEWCWRVNSKGFKIFKSAEVVLPHKVGSKTISFLGFPIIISAPFRYYYQYRNFFWLLKTPYAPRSWKIKGLLRKFVGLILVPFKVAEKKATMYYMLKGVSHGIFKSMK